MTTTKERTREISKQTPLKRKRGLSLDEEQISNKRQKIEEEKKEKKMILIHEQREFPISKRRLNKPWVDNGVRTEINVNTNSFVLFLDMKKIWNQTSNHNRQQYLSNIPICKDFRETKTLSSEIEK